MKKNRDIEQWERISRVFILSICLTCYFHDSSKACNPIITREVNELYKPFLGHPGSSLSDLPNHLQLWTELSDRLARRTENFFYASKCRPNWSILILGASYDISNFRIAKKTVTVNICRVTVEFLNRSMPTEIEMTYTNTNGNLGIDEIEGHAAGHSYSLQYMM